MRQLDVDRMEGNSKGDLAYRPNNLPAIHAQHNRNAPTTSVGNKKSADYKLQT